jgi:hypothetical protein
MMGILNTIKNIADGTDAVKRIHDTSKYFKSEYIDPAMKPNQPMPISIDAPKTVKVNQPVTIKGTGTGMVSLYSGDHLERELYPDKKGEWYIRLYFSVPGEYLLTAKDYYGTAQATLNATE